MKVFLLSSSLLVGLLFVVVGASKDARAALVETRRCAQLGPIAYSRPATAADFKADIAQFHGLATAGFAQTRGPKGEGQTLIDLRDANQTRIVEVITSASGTDAARSGDAHLVASRAPLPRTFVTLESKKDVVEEIHLTLHRGQGEARLVVSLFAPEADGHCGKIW